MARIFVPRMTGFTNTQIKNELDKIKKRYTFLTEENIKQIERWSDTSSDHEGTIITEGGTNICWPAYDMDRKSFIESHPNGEVWIFQH